MDQFICAIFSFELSAVNSGSNSSMTPLMPPLLLLQYFESIEFTPLWINQKRLDKFVPNFPQICCILMHILSSDLLVVKMAPILSRPLGRLLIPTLSRAISSGFLVHEPKYSFLKVKQWQTGMIRSVSMI